MPALHQPPIPAPRSMQALGPSARIALMRLVNDSIPVQLAYYVGPDLRCLYANRSYANYFDQTVDSIVGRTVQETIGDSAWELVQRYIIPLMTRAEPQKYLREHFTAAGELRMLEVQLLPHVEIADRDPIEVTGVFVLVTDVTHLWEATQAIRRSETRMRKFTDATDEGIVFQREGFITDANASLLRLLGYALTEMVGKPIFDFVSNKDRGRAKTYTFNEREDHVELEIQHKSGKRIPVEISAKTLPSSEGDFRVIAIRDISARKQAQKQATYLSTHDALTQLPNRRQLMQALARMLAVAPGERGLSALLFIDIDHFRTVNESLGHEAGDQLLTEVAKRLQNSVHSTDFVARVGGDQFAVLLPFCENRAAVAGVAEMLIRKMQSGFTINEQPLSLSPSMGICVAPDDGTNGDDLLHRAAAALQRAKDNGRSTWKFYTAEMDCPPSETLAQEHLLRKAVFLESFELRFQPQIDVTTRKLTGLEALVRWQHPENGLVGPNDFIPIAEARGLVAPIGRWVLREACRQMRAWHNEGLSCVPIAVNLSAMEFQRRDVVGDIATILQETNLPPHLLEVEMTESSLVQNVEEARQVLQGMRDLGVAVTIDDFGTGYSSLAYLKHFPVGKLKIDRAFVIDLATDPADVAIVKAIVQMAHSLSMRTVAEGVETEEQLALLRTMGCDIAQGYGIARPLNATQTREWLSHMGAQNAIRHA